MIAQLLQRYEREIISGTEQWERFDNEPERAYIRGIQAGAQLLESSLQEVIGIAEEGGDLAQALEDLVADLVKRVAYEKQAIDATTDVSTKLGYMKALECGVQELQAAAQEAWHSECNDME